MSPGGVEPDRGTGRRVARRGRPPGGNSDETRRKTSSTSPSATSPNSGYSSTSLTAIAAEAGLATSAVYHYFDGKEQLYEAVFFSIAPKVWEGIAESIAGPPTMLAGLETLLHGRGGQQGPYVNPFLAGMPTVATLHPEFAHLLTARTKFQDSVFRALSPDGAGHRRAHRPHHRPGDRNAAGVRHGLVLRALLRRCRARRQP